MPSRPIGPFVGYGLVLVAVGVALAAVGWTADVDEVSFWLWFRWSSTLGVLLDLAVTAAVLQRSVGALETLWVPAGIRFVAVVLGIVLFGWDDGGRSDPTYLLVLAVAGVTAAASVVLTLGARRRLRAGALTARRT